MLALQGLVGTKNEESPFTERESVLRKVQTILAKSQPTNTIDSKLLDRAILETFGELVNASNGEVVSSDTAGPVAE